MAWKFSRGDELAFAIAIFVGLFFGVMLLIHFLQPEGRETPVPAAQEKQHSQKK